MKVILTQDVKNLGRKGAVVEVAEGYARNFLLPRGLATLATSGALKSVQFEKQREDLKARRALEVAKGQAEQLAGRTVTVKAKAGEAHRLFGSVTAHDVADAIQRELGVTIDKRKVELPQPIKTLGRHAVTVRLHPAVMTELTVLVEKA